MISKISAFFMRRKNWTIPYALFLAVFVVMPLLLIVLYAFTDADGAFTFANFRKFMVHPEAMNTFVYSIGIAIITTLACLILGYPAAYILSQERFNTSRTMVVLFILPGEYPDPYAGYGSIVRFPEPAVGRGGVGFRYGV